MRRALTIATIAAVAALVADDAAAQCAMCRTALESPEAAALAAGFRRAVLFLLAVPFTAIAVIAVMVARSVRTPANAPDD